MYIHIHVYVGVLHPSNLASLVAYIHSQGFVFKLRLWELSVYYFLNIDVFSHGSQMSIEISCKM